jgi:hypothetical protein
VARPPSFRVPRQQIDSFRRIAELEDAEFGDLLDAVASTAVEFDSQRLTERVAGVLTINYDAASELVRSLTTLFLFRTPPERDPLETAGTVAADDNLDLDDEHRLTLKARVSALLTAPSIQAVAKTLDVSTGQERTFTEAKVFTGVRPIFGADVSDPPIGAVLVHELRIEYIEGQDVKSIFVVLDSSDVNELRKTLDRADDKATSIKSFLKGTELYFHEPEEET